MAAFCTTIAYLIAERATDGSKESLSWQRMGRIGFGIHGIAVLGIIVVLFYMIWGHFYEYNYVFSHSSNDLPVRYMISCFWEGQEGSFLLWTFWHVVLGWIVIKKANKWENSVMTIVSFTQCFLAAMLIGIYFFGYKIGSTPFILLRDINAGLPLFLNPEYLTKVTDGNGLNPLLQNYWMVIHPPVLFLGFAGMLLPFAYVLAGLWRRDFSKQWIMPTLSWALFSNGVLGVGILMGGAWAYESLSFGGYWAWDPVENASFVPWVIGICGIHTLLSYKHSKHALRTTIFFLVLAFILILYSTFLTRSGILGDTSVHAFVDLGMSGQLLVFLFAFIGLTVFLSLPKGGLRTGYFASFAALVVINIVFYQEFMLWIDMAFFGFSLILMIYGLNVILPGNKDDEPVYSREFWLLIGSLIMFIVSGKIIYDTSLPVVNQIFGTEYAIVEAVTHYNRYSIWFGILVLFMAATTLFLRYRSKLISNGKLLGIYMLVSLVASIIIARVAEFDLLRKASLFGIENISLPSPLFILLLASVYSIIANVAYIFQVVKGQVKVAGAAIAHLGFGLMLLGVLFSSGKKEVISLNNIGLDYGDQFSVKDKMENIFLAKNKAIQMGDYWVTYEDTRIDRFDTYYKIAYEKKANETDPAEERFVLEPYAQINPKMGLITNPSSKKYLTKDIFTYISTIPDKEANAAEAETSFKEIEIGVGDTMAASNSLITLQAINPSPIHSQYIAQAGDIALGAKLHISTLDQKKTIEPIYYIRGNQEYRIPDEIKESGISIDIAKVLPDEGKILLEVTEIKQSIDYVIMKAIVFPFINILWLGCIVMSFGFFLSLWQRYKEGKKLVKE